MLLILSLLLQDSNGKRKRECIREHIPPGQREFVPIAAGDDVKRKWQALAVRMSPPGLAFES